MWPGQVTPFWSVPAVDGGAIALEYLHAAATQVSVGPGEESLDPWTP